MHGTITMTLEEILSNCDDWEKFCEEMGYSMWAVNEGGGDTEVEMTVAEARRFGLCIFEEAPEED